MALAKAGHSWNLERPDKFFSALRPFLQNDSITKLLISSRDPWAAPVTAHTVTRVCAWRGTRRTYTPQVVLEFGSGSRRSRHHTLTPAALAACASENLRELVVMDVGLTEALTSLRLHDISFKGRYGEFGPVLGEVFPDWLAARARAGISLKRLDLRRCSYLSHKQYSKLRAALPHAIIVAPNGDPGKSYWVRWGHIAMGRDADEESAPALLLCAHPGGSGAQSFIVDHVELNDREGIPSMDEVLGRKLDSVQLCCRREEAVVPCGFSKNPGCTEFSEMFPVDASCILVASRPQTSVASFRFDIIARRIYTVYGSLPRPQGPQHGVFGPELVLISSSL
ncbi:hypothetical protein FA95DRAFT_1347799 [Auriscalpium vulgare]|uniref:Uncharacterized protein n=1 Tax=Auriscalpium vulgare TaxID=40419 RepID=A0ACB8RRC3_9AGAM|nr:hypothetical protein FA95DRAFT_1347799 [Auriscalpium vulgare]